MPAKRSIKPMAKPKASLPDQLPKFVVTRPTKRLDTFKSPRPGRPFEIVFTTEEFTCLCPLTGQPDFAHIAIRYQPDQLCVESKSLKLYLWSFREQGAFHEAVTNQILDDLVAAIQPQWMRVEGDFLIRGGIRTVVVAEHGKKQ
ncbi:MAG TPA: preQ(1) synthase [Holophagaceae bacterium]|nr:preQ(1) synthase [Holophagaceae bacterium]